MNSKQVLETLHNLIVDPDWWTDIDNPALQSACKEIEMARQSAINLAEVEVVEDIIDEERE